MEKRDRVLADGGVLAAVYGAVSALGDGIRRTAADALRGCVLGARDGGHRAEGKEAVA